MWLKKALEEKVFDLRLRDKLIAEGKVTKKEIDEYLKKLGDDENNIDQTDAE